MKKLLLLLLFPFICNAQLGLDPIPSYAICESETDGFAEFDLNNHIEMMLSPENYNWKFYLDQAAIDSDTSLSESGSYVNLTAYQQTIYVVITDIDSGISQTLSFNLIVTNAPSSATPSTFAQCDESLPNDGITVFNLTAKDNEIKGICFDCTVSYHLSSEDALSNIAITNPENFSNTSNPQVIYARVTAPSIANCYQIITLTLKVLPLPTPDTTPNPLILCDNNNSPDGIENFNLTAAEADIRDNDNQSIITYYATLVSAEAGSNAIADPTIYSSGTGSVWVRMEANTGNPSDPKCYQVVELMLAVNPKPKVLITSIGIIDNDGIADNNTMVNLESYVPAMLGEDYLNYTVTFYASESDISSGTPITSPYTTGTTTVYYRIENTSTNCVLTGNIEIIILPQDYETPAPIGITEQTFTEGETLADIEIEGENIQWYDNSGEGNDFIFTPKNGELPLPLTTTLVDETTYYASQTIYNIESDKRLAVTVLKTLGAKDNQFTGMAYYPNPVKNDLTIINSNEIETVSIVNMLGQTIANKQINSTTAQIDLSSLQSGVYIINITSGSKNKTIKIVKE